MRAFYTFLIDQLISSSYHLEIAENELRIETNGAIHTEPIFFDSFSFEREEIVDLLNISRDVQNAKEPNVMNQHFPFVKIWFLITHEYYFKPTIKTDQYDRIGYENLLDEFKEILKVPIADVIRGMLCKKLSVFQESKTKIYLTCDFDILNIWDVWKVKDLVREIYLCAIKLQFRKGIETIGTFLFSRFFSRYNGFLNDRMYCYDEGFINQGFFIATTSNKKFDGVIRYNNKLVQRYISRLKSKKVQFGLHTNFDTMDDPMSIHQQQSDFEKLFGVPAIINRHHYLRLRNPNYLKTLELGGIKEDYSLYFPESMIFRAGISSGFQVWNFEENRPYNVKVIPTTIMDGTFSDYMHTSYEKSKELAVDKIKLALKFGENIVLLWHNRSTYRYANIEDNFHPELIDALIAYLKQERNQSNQ